MTEEKQTVKDRRNTGGLRAFSSAAMPLVRKILGKKAFVIADLLAFWHQIVGEETAAYSTPLKADFKKNEKTDGVLHVAVPNGAFALELQHRERFVIDNINSYFGYRLIGKIRIIQDGSFHKHVLNEINQPTQKKVLVSFDEQNYISNLTEDIIDPELKETLERLGKSVFNDKKE